MHPNVKMRAATAKCRVAISHPMQLSNVWCRFLEHRNRPMTIRLIVLSVLALLYLGREVEFAHELRGFLARSAAEELPDDVKARLVATLDALGTS